MAPILIKDCITAITGTRAGRQRHIGKLLGDVTWHGGLQEIHLVWRPFPHLQSSGKLPLVLDVVGKASEAN